MGAPSTQQPVWVTSVSLYEPQLHTGPTVNVPRHVLVSTMTSTDNQSILKITRPLGHAHGMSAPERQFMPRTLPPSWYDPQVRAAAIILCPPQTAPWPPVAQTTMPGRCGDVNRTQEYETTCTRYEPSARGVVTVGIIR